MDVVGRLAATIARLLTTSYTVSDTGLVELNRMETALVGRLRAYLRAVPLQNKDRVVVEAHLHDAGKTLHRLRLTVETLTPEGEGTLTTP